MNKKSMIIRSIIIFFLVVISIILGLIYCTYKNTYTIHYSGKSNNYDIYLINDKIIVKYNTIEECLVAPCPTRTEKKEINFSKEKQKIIKDYIKEKTNNKRTINLNADQLNQEETSIIQSIIYNDEQLLILNDISDSSYIVTTNIRWKTMQNDGGSHTNVFYIIDMDTGSVIKKRENYDAKTKNKDSSVVYKKKIDDNLLEKSKEVFDNAISDVTIRDKTYDFYTIEYNNVESYIYNKDTIDSIESILTEIDNYE